MPRTALLLALLAVAAAGAAGGFAPHAEWSPREFPISFWCGPPDPHITVEKYRQVGAAGFDYLMPPCEGAATAERNRRILDTARQAGLKAFLQDDRMPLALAGSSDAKQRLDAIVADYAKHPAFAGYSLTDEPGAGAFAGLAEVAAYLRQKDPAHPAYINLLPNYASPEQMGVLTYSRYVEQFIETVDPAIVSYDHYHFLKTGDRPGFYGNLDAVRRLALKHEVPFWQIVLSIPHLSYRPLTEAEKRFEAMQTLAFGGKGLMYFTYWTPPGGEGEWSAAIIDREGKPTTQYAEVQRINADVRAIGKYLIDAVPTAVFMSGSPAPDMVERVPGTPVRIDGEGDVTVGLFRRDTHLYVLVANRDYRGATSVKAFLSAGGRTTQHLDRKTGRWTDAKTRMTPEGEREIAIKLAPGDGELLRW